MQTLHVSADPNDYAQGAFARTYSETLPFSILRVRALERELPLEVAHTSSSHHDAVDLVLNSVLAHIRSGLATHAQRVDVGESSLRGSGLHLRQLLLGLSL